MTTPVSRLDDTLAAARAENRAVLVGYLPAGYPSLQGGIDAIVAMVRGGVDVVEIGLPYSDPLMDGPTIQRAVEAALQRGTTTDDVLTTVRGVASTGAPTLVMSYWNPIERYGVRRFADATSSSSLTTSNQLAAVSTSLSPRPERFTSTVAPSPSSRPTHMAPANACALSIAGMMPSVRQSRAKASIASPSSTGA